jgi:hypothetical protein
MNEQLAERLLAKVMGWTDVDVARERPVLQDFASLKYDEYHNFSPGMRFVESLALWLQQFTDPAQKKCAYRFIRRRLVFFSDAEISHFVGVTFPDYVRPLLIERVARQLSVTKGQIVSHPESPEYVQLLRQTLFLGMSDGARIDSFRRENKSIDHEQVYTTYEIGDGRVEEMLRKLSSSINQSRGTPESSESFRFRCLVLIDDLSASGTTCVGKLKKIFAEIPDPTKPLGRLLDLADLEVYVALFLATERATDSISKFCREVQQQSGLNIPTKVVVVQSLPESITVTPERDRELFAILPDYFDPAIIDEHYRKGKMDAPFLGFDECALPVVLSHNTPNNSIPLIWSQEDRKWRGVFPRVTRHGGRR